jgi:hypothetical protein
VSSKTTTISDWLLDAKDLKPGDQINIYLDSHGAPAPSFPDMRAALHKQFGEDTLIRIYKHGRRICIFIHPDDESRERFDQRNVHLVIRHGGKRTEIENGFTRDLPSTVRSHSKDPHHG